MKKKIKLKKSVKILLAISIVALIVMLILVGHKVCTKYIFKDTETEPVIKPIEKEEIELENYDYYIRSNATEYEKTLFEELKNILVKEERNNDEYANVIAKLFICDLFTLKNKNSSSDISSSQYVYDEYKDTFKTMVKDTIYSNIEIDLDGKRTQSLPSVTNVEVISVNKNSFKLNKDVIDSEAYYIKTNISYETDLNYPTEYEIVLVKNNDLLQVVKAS